MKKIITLILVMSTYAGYAQVKNAALKVSGDCEMCKKSIETAVKKVNGVQLAAWDAKSKYLSLRYDTTSTNLVSISNAINAVGYDTEVSKADIKSYRKLDLCCRYRGKE